MRNHRPVFPKWRALIFDLDGTLIDSKLDLALAVNAALEELGSAPLPHETIFSYVGQGAPNLIARAWARGPPKKIAARPRIFIKYYFRATSSITPRCIPAFVRRLDTLKGMPMAVLTNKPVGASREFSQGLGLKRTTFALCTAATVLNARSPIPWVSNDSARIGAARACDVRLLAFKTVAAVHKAKVVRQAQTLENSAAGAHGFVGEDGHRHTF